jgi:hypothetical protein
MSDDRTMTRRTWLASMASTVAGGATLNFILPSLARADGALPALTVYKDPSCGCCTEWVAHLKANGFTTTVKERSDMDSLKVKLGVPVALRTCHTAVAGKYLIEGHVPAADMKRLFSTAPKDVIGLAVPGMPAGSPGMDVPGQSDRYEVIAFSADGKTHVFATHG